ncbi:hypothetical protein V8J88_07995 [Massilia sp. W12]|uniref:hypothetical protein n=1 Tax=Massilia sp. W12 TaxID=3126507 RepID=UPI0030D14FCD
MRGDKRPGPGKAGVVARLLLAYLLAGAVLMLYLQWPHLNGHAHLPFSTFPSNLLWAALAPLMIASEFSARLQDGVISLLLFGAAFAGFARVLLRTGN